MISIDILIKECPGLDRDDLDRWIGNDWIRADGEADGLQFHEIDVARIRLIQELRDDLQVTDALLPVVLSLLDQLYDMRRRMRHLLTGPDRRGSLEI